MKARKVNSLFFWGGAKRFRVGLGVGALAGFEPVVLNKSCLLVADCCGKLKSEPSGLDM